MSNPYYRVGKDDRIVVDGRELRLGTSTRTGYVFDVVDQPGRQIAFTRAEFCAAVRRRGFRRDRNHYVRGRAAACASAQAARLSGVPRREHAGILFRHGYVTRFLAIEAAGEVSRSDDGMARAVARIHGDLTREHEARQADAAPKGTRKVQVNARSFEDRADRALRQPGVKTLLRWVKRYEEGGRSELALRYGHHRSGNRERRMSTEMRDLVAAAARGYMSPQRPTRAMCFRSLKISVRQRDRERTAQGLPPVGRPSKRALDAAISALPKAHVHAARHGIAKAEAKFGPLGAGPDVTRAGQRVEMDEWEVHALTLLEDHGLLEKLDATWRKTAERHRLFVCEALDAATRLTLGLSFSSRENSSENALACLAMVFSDKTALAKWAGAVSRWDMRCSPEEIVTDGGSGFVSDDFVAAVLDLLGEKATTPAKRPQLRGRIERRFRTRELRLMPFVPGRTFSHIVDKGDYDAHERAAILDVVLRRLVIIDAVDVCANSPNVGGLKGATPLDTWDKLVETRGIYPEPDAESRRNALGIRLTRTLGRHGVRVLGLNYSSSALQRWFRTHGACSVDARADPADLGRISVWADGGWLECGCLQRGLAGVPMDVWVAAEADLQRRHAEQSRLSESTVLDAIERTRAIVGAAESQFGLGGACPSTEELEQWEARMSTFFAIPDDVEEPSPRDLKTAAVPRGTPIPTYAVMGEDAPVAPAGGGARRRDEPNGATKASGDPPRPTEAEAEPPRRDDEPGSVGADLQGPPATDRAPSPEGDGDDFNHEFEDHDDFDHDI